MKRDLSLACLLCVCLIALFVQPVSAQTINPRTAYFTASGDHDTVVSGLAAIERYELAVMVGSATGAMAFSKDLGKPNPNAQREIAVTIPEFATMASGSYVATVSAIGPGGVARSAPSNPFSRINQPAAPTGVGVRQ